MPETTFDIAGRLRSVVAASVKAGHAAADPVGILAAKAALLQRKGADGLTVEVLATTDDIDSDDEVVLPGGADPTYFLRNGSVFLDHMTYSDARVGVVRGIRPWPLASAQRGWLADISMDKTPKAIELLEQINNGGYGVSIGFRSRDRGTPTPEEAKRYARDGKQPRSIVRKWDWMELSFTPMPCNVACRVVSMPMAEPKSAPRSARKQFVVMGDVVFTRKFTAPAAS